MKNHKSCLLFLLFSVCFFLTTCSNPNNSTDEIEEDGITRIVITLPGGNTGKSRVVGDPALVEYELLFQGPDGQTFTKTASGGQTVTVQVVPGLWTVKVRSYDPVTGIDEAKGEALNFDVKAGQNNSVLIQMRFVQMAPIALYLASATGGGSASDPVSLHLDIPLTASDWGTLLSAIDTSGKYVDLNLSACTDSGSASGAGLRSDGTFDPDSSVMIGKNYVVSLALPDTATKIADWAWGNPPFYGFSALVTFSGVGLTTIGDCAFYGCTSLALTSLPPNVTTIGENAFTQCTSLALTYLPAGVTTIGEGAFYNCASLALTSLPAGVTTIGEGAFAQCTSLALSSLPASLSYIGGTAFMWCTSLTLTSLPASLATIGDYAFLGCTSLALTSLPLGLTHIGTSAFWGCTGLTSMSLPATISLDGNPFEGCPSLLFTLSGTGPLSTIEGGKALVKNGTELVAYPSATGSIDLTGFTAISDFAFSNCASLTTVTLPASITTIGNRAFNDCTNLALTSLPAGVTTIGEGAFACCMGLTLSSLPAGLSSISRNAFFGCGSLTSIDLTFVTSIEEGAFVECTSLVSVTLGSGVFFNTTHSTSFDGDLDSVYSGAGTYTRPFGGTNWTWGP